MGKFTISRGVATTRTSNHSTTDFKMDKQTLKAAILIVSTTAAKDASTDSSGPILKGVFEEAGGQWEVVETKIVSDNVTDIQRSVMSWTDQGNTINVVITTGGTGFAVSDNTPEVIQ